MTAASSLLPARTTTSEDPLTNKFQAAPDLGERARPEPRARGDAIAVCGAVSPAASVMLLGMARQPRKQRRRAARSLAPATSPAPARNPGWVPAARNARARARRRPPELLAPAGDADCLHAALQCGADAVYFGVREGFNARARAGNFALESLAETVALVHRCGARAYLALNTLVFEPELTGVEQVIRSAAAAGVGAVLVQDPAVALIAQRTAPGLDIHAACGRRSSGSARRERRQCMPLAWWISLRLPLGMRLPSLSHRRRKSGAGVTSRQSREGGCVEPAHRTAVLGTDASSARQSPPPPGTASRFRQVSATGRSGRFDPQPPA
jgi:hypothetical protein